MQLYKDFSEGVIKVANCVQSEECGGTYGDAAILLCSAISGMASMRWPGINLDKNRFVQILIEADGLTWKKISLPLLAQSWDAMWENLPVPDFPQVPQSSEDVFDGDVFKKFSEKHTKKCSEIIRQHSYACLLYTEIRCGYSHEMLPGGRATSSPGLYDNTSSVSYENYSIYNKENIFQKKKRRIHFPVPLIADAVEKIGRHLDSECKTHKKKYSEKFDENAQNTWWLKG
jgi:hypothetical protein